MNRYNGQTRVGRLHVRGLCRPNRQDGFARSRSSAATSSAGRLLAARPHVRAATYRPDSRAFGASDCRRATRARADHVSTSTARPQPRTVRVAMLPAPIKSNRTEARARNMYGNDRPDNLYTCSLVGPRCRHRKLKWHYQLHTHDVTLGMPSPTLRSHEGQRQAGEAVRPANRNGFFYALDRATRKLLAARSYTKFTWLLASARMTAELSRP